MAMGLGLGLGLAQSGAAAPPTLAALSLSASTVAENSAASTVIGAIQGGTGGSTITIQTQSNTGWFSISGGNLVVAGSIDYETNAAPTVTLRETLAGATNTPRDTVVNITVTDVAEAKQWLVGNVAANDNGPRQFMAGARLLCGS